MTTALSTAREDDSMVRISTELSAGEKSAREKRNEVVRDAIKNLTGQSVKKGCSPPTIAVLGSGGGMRATIAMLGTLQALAESNVLDCVSYVSGVSGSTWAMIQLYQQETWSEDIKQIVSDLRSQLTESKTTLLESIEYLIQKENDSPYSLTNFWGATLVYYILGKIDTSKLTDHQDAASKGKNPYPIYAAVDGGRKQHSHAADAWFEFTPHEAGFPSPGMFVSMKQFNSQFEDGKETTENEQRDLNYLEGLWGSALADMNAIIDWIKDYLWKLVPSAEISSSSGSEKSRCEYCSGKFMGLIEKLETMIGEGNFESALSKLPLKETVLHCLSEHLETVNEEEDTFLMMIGHWYSLLAIWYNTSKALLFWNWGENFNFAYHEHRIKELSLRGQELYNAEYVYLIDAGLENNCAYPLVLRKERKVDLILSFDFSAGDTFLTLTEARDYCNTNSIPFPDLPPDLDRPRHDVYVLTKPKARSVMHFPLFNDCNCKGICPEQMMDKYSTFKQNYTGEEFDEVLKAASQNVRNNVGKIKEHINALL